MSRLSAVVTTGLAFVLTFDGAAAAQQAPPGYPSSAPPGYPSSGGYAASTANPALPNPAASPNAADESKDSGLGLEWVYLNGDIGFATASMNSFSASNLALTKTASSGPAFGVGAGVRLIFVDLGVRVHDLDLSDLGTLWELNAEVKFHTRVWRIDPYFGVRGGYNFVGSLSSSTSSVAVGQTPGGVSVHGFNVGPVFGIDFYLAKLVSIGVDLDTQFLFLQRPKVNLPGGVTVQQQCAADAQCNHFYNASGNSIGGAFVPTAHLGIHF